MRTLHHNDYMHLEVDEGKKIFRATWLEGTERMTTKEMQQEVVNAMEFLVNNKSEFYLADDRSRKYLYTVEDQPWIGEKVNAGCIEAGITKFAVLVPTEIILELSTEQTVDELEGYTTHFFDNEAAAIEWFGI